MMIYNYFTYSLHDFQLYNPFTNEIYMIESLDLELSANLILYSTQVFLNLTKQII